MSEANEELSADAGEAGRGSDGDAEHLAVGAKALALAQVLGQVTRLATNVVLAHLISPTDFGTVAIALVVMAFLDQFRDLGTGSALIQRRTLTTELLNSVFFLNAVMGVLIATVMFFSAGSIASAVSKNPDPDVLRAFAAAALVTSLGQIHHALLRRDLRFRVIAGISIVNNVITAVVAIGLAFAGLDAWALVIGTLAGTFFDNVAVWFYDRWRPSRAPSWSALRSIAKYSTNLFASNVLIFFFNQTDKVLVSRFLGAHTLGIYAMAQRILTYPMYSIAGVVTEVTFPAFARNQDDTATLRSGYVRVNGIVALVSFPIMGIIAAVARPAVDVVLGPAWHDLTPLVWILAPAGALQCVAYTANQLLIAKGETGALLRWLVFSSAVVITGYLIGLNWGLVGLCGGFAVATAIITPLNLRLAFGRLELSAGAFVRPIAPIAAATIVAAAVSLGVQRIVSTLGGADLLLLLTGLTTGLVTFGALILVLRPAALDDAVLAIRARRTGPVTGS